MSKQSPVLRRLVELSAVALGAGLVLTACSPVQVGSAAIVGNQRITIATLDTEVTNLSQTVKLYPATVPLSQVQQTQQAAPASQTASEALSPTPAASIDPEQVKQMAQSLDELRQTVGQLAAAQEQFGREKLQAACQDPSASATSQSPRGRHAQAPGGAAAADTNHLAPPIGRGDPWRLNEEAPTAKLPTT